MFKRITKGSFGRELDELVKYHTKCGNTAFLEWLSDIGYLKSEQKEIDFENGLREFLTRHGARIEYSTIKIGNKTFGFCS